MNRTKAFAKLSASLLVMSFLGYECKKDSSIPTTLPVAEQSQILNADAQDAVADKTDQDIDKTLDALQNNGYQSANTQSSLKASGNSITITVDKEDSTNFPKLVTIKFNNYVDSSGTENFIKNGEIAILITAPLNDKKLITKVQTFKDFSVSTDSSTMIINGFRTVKRTAITSKITSSSTINNFIVDSIIGTLKYSVTSGNDTSSFTRVVAKQRTAFLHYAKLAPLKWKNVITKDTLKYTGIVTGKNEKGYTYTKTVTNVDPFTVLFYQYKPVVVAGTMEYTVTNANQETTSYSLKFSESDKNLHKSQTIVVNNKTGKTFTYEKKLGRKFRKW